MYVIVIVVVVVVVVIVVAAVAAVAAVAVVVCSRRSVNLRWSYIAAADMHSSLDNRSSPKDLIVLDFLLLPLLPPVTHASSSCGVCPHALVYWYNLMASSGRARNVGCGKAAGRVSSARHELDPTASENKKIKTEFIYFLLLGPGSW